MIIEIGGLSLKVEVKGDDLNQIEANMRETFKGFISSEQNYDFSLDIWPVPKISLWKIFNKEERGHIRNIIDMAENRFPFSKLDYGWKNSLSGLRTFKKISEKIPNYLPAQNTRKIEDDAIILPHRKFLLIYNEKGRKGDVFVTGGGVNEYMLSILFIIQATFSTVSPKRNSLFFHACSAGMNGDGFIFFGGPGYGKSTIARSFRERDIFSDDGTLCIKGEESYLISPTPFTQVPGTKKRKETLPIKRLFFLNQDKTNYMNRISPGSAMVKILHNYIHFFRFFNKEEAFIAFHLIQGLVKSVPSYDLHFNLNFNPESFFDRELYEKEKEI